MSRVGRRPIPVPDGVKVQVLADRVVVEGAHGKLEQRFEPEWVSVSLEDGQLRVTRRQETPQARARHGLYRSLLANMVRGVQEPYTKSLVLKGLGYRARLQGRELVVEAGYSQPVTYAIPAGVTVEVLEGTEIVVKGADKQLVGQVAADIRAIRKPEPYKGTGIRYKDEQIRRKAGKLGGATQT